METLKRLRYIVKPNDHFVSFNMQYHFYALSIHPKDREAFTLNLDGHLLQLCALSMGWSLFPYTFQKCTDVFVNKLRDPEATVRPGRAPNLSAKAKKKWPRRQRLRTGARLLHTRCAIFYPGRRQPMKKRSFGGLHKHRDWGLLSPNTVTSVTESFR